MNFNFLDEGCIIYTLLYFLTFILTLFVSRRNDRKKCFYLIVFLEILIGSLRGLDVGSDTHGYVEQFSYIRSITYSEFFKNTPWFAAKEPICWLFFKFISDPFSTYTPYFTILQVIFWILVGNTILRYSKDPLMALFVFISFRHSFFNLTAMRQGLALAITTFSYRYYETNKKLPFVLFVIIASLFHRSALIFLLVLFIRQNDYVKKQWLVYLLTLVSLFVLYLFNSIGLFAHLAESNVIYASRLNVESQGNYFSVIFMLIVFALVTAFIKFNNNKVQYSRLYNFMILSLVFTIFGLFVAIGFRITMYFSFLVPILYSNTLAGITCRNTRSFWTISGLLIFALIYVCTGVVEGYTPYKFCWDAY